MRTFIAASVVSVLMIAAPAQAQTRQPTEDAAPFGPAAPVETKELSGIAGQADVQQVVSAQNKAEVSRNTVSGNSVTGTVGLGDSFQNSSGLSIVSANTGNNVAINSSLNVNVSIHP